MSTRTANPAQRAVAVTKSDTAIIAARALYIGTTGDVAIVPIDGSAAVTFKTVPVGFFPVSCKILMSTGTSAAEIIALY